MTSRPAAAAAPSPMTVSSMVRPLAVVTGDMGISSGWDSVRRAGAVLQRSGRQKVRERAEISYKYFAEAANAACPGVSFSGALRVLFLMLPAVSGSRRPAQG